MPPLRLRGALSFPGVRRICVCALLRMLCRLPGPIPGFRDLRRRYGESYFAYEYRNERNFFTLMELGLRDVDFEARAARLGSHRTFLDIGCATGMLLESMQHKGWTVPRGSTSPGSPRSTESGTGELISFPARSTKPPFPDNSFSVVHLSPSHRACA